MVEVLHFMGGEDSPRRVLCPWRAHLLASTLPAVARATAACSVRCECMIGRGIGLLRGSSSGWCVRCSSGCDNLENGGQAGSRRQWLGPLTTDGQPCDEHLTDLRARGALMSTSHTKGHDVPNPLDPLIF